MPYVHDVVHVALVDVPERLVFLAVSQHGVVDLQRDRRDVHALLPLRRHSCAHPGPGQRHADAALLVYLRVADLQLHHVRRRKLIVVRRGDVLLSVQVQRRAVRVLAHRQDRRHHIVGDLIAVHARQVAAIGGIKAPVHAGTAQDRDPVVIDQHVAAPAAHEAVVAVQQRVDAVHVALVEAGPAVADVGGQLQVRVHVGVIQDALQRLRTGDDAPRERVRQDARCIVGDGQSLDLDHILLALRLLEPEQLRPHLHAGQALLHLLHGGGVQGVDLHVQRGRVHPTAPALPCPLFSILHPRPVLHRIAIGAFKGHGDLRPCGHQLLFLALAADLAGVDVSLCLRGPGLHGPRLRCRHQRAIFDLRHRAHRHVRPDDVPGLQPLPAPLGVIRMRNLQNRAVDALVDVLPVQRTQRAQPLTVKIVGVGQVDVDGLAHQ